MLCTICYWTFNFTQYEFNLKALEVYFDIILLTLMLKYFKDKDIKY